MSHRYCVAGKCPDDNDIPIQCVIDVSEECVSTIKETIVSDWIRFRPPELSDHAEPPVVEVSLEEKEHEVVGEEYLQTHPQPVLRLVKYVDPGDEGVTLSIYRDGVFEFYDLCRVTSSPQGTMEMTWRRFASSGDD